MSFVLWVLRPKLVLLLTDILQNPFALEIRCLLYLRDTSRGVMVKAMDCGIVFQRVRTSIGLLRSLFDKYRWERYEAPYPPHYGLNSTTTVLLEG